MQYTGKVFFILGVAGSGKNTVIHNVLQTDLPLSQVISCKTRPLRPTERDGVDYHYLSEEEFEVAKGQGEFLEYALVHQLYRYGTRKKDLVEKLKEGKYVIKEIDIHGLMIIAKEHPDIWAVTKSIFLDIPDETMIERVTSRAALSDKEMQNRLQSAIKERQLAKEYCTDIIDATPSQEEVAAHVYALISQYISEE